MKEREQLKNYAFCNCLSYCLPKSDPAMITDGSIAGYFEIGKYSIDVYDKVDSLANLASMKKYPSKGDKPLSFMKCLGFTVLRN